MVNWSFLTKAYKYVGVEILGVITMILAVQEIFKISLDLTSLIYILIVLSFVDAVIKLMLNAYKRVRLNLTLTSKMCKEYTIDQLRAEINKDKTTTEQIVDAKNKVEVKAIEKELAKLESQ